MPSTVSPTARRLIGTTTRRPASNSEHALLTLRRIAETIQKILLLCREKHYERIIDKIEKKDGKLYIHEDTV